MKSDKLYPLTSVQKEIWFDQIINPDIPIYNIGGYVKIDGPVESAVFGQAARRVVKENDALRIVLREKDPLPFQEFSETIDFDMGFNDFSDKEDSMSYTLEWMNREFIKPFELYDRHLFDFALIKVSDNCFCWFKKYHHLITDGWGISIIVRRVAEAYNEIISGKEHPAHDEIFSYKNFITDDLKYIDSEKFQSHKKYWADKYASLPDSIIPARYGYDNSESRVSELWLKRDLYNCMAAFARENRASVFHFILGAMYVYFLRTSNAEDFVIGLPVLNRSSKAFKNTAGLFVGVSPTKFSFGTELTFAELIKKIGKELRKDYRNQRFPVGEINRLAGLHKEGKKQLFDLELSYEKHDYTTDFNGNQAAALPLLNRADRNPLSVFIREFHEDRDVRIDFSYNCGTFKDEEIKLIKARFTTIFKEILYHPDIPVQQLEIMPEKEKRKILIEWNDTNAEYPKNKCIHQLFEEQAEKTPEAVAVVFEDELLTYKELNERANQLGCYLQELGVGPEVLVGIYMERSIEMIVGLLGILKAGGAYVPLDPEYPPERLAFMLEDTKAPILLTQAKLLDSLHESKIRPICIDKNWELIVRGSWENVKSNVRPENLTYVIYTSGSTGKPKGTLVEHRNIVNLTVAQKKSFKIDENEKILQFSSLCFDASTKQIWLALSSGSVIVLVTEEILIDRNAFERYIFKHKVTYLNAVPSFLNNLVLRKSGSIKRVIAGGEACPMELAKRLSSDYDFYNVYGPTEATVLSLEYTVTGKTFILNKVPIGRPIANTQIYILDKQLKPVPTGVSGELHIGGAGVARGYLNRPDLTKEKFIPDPFTSEPDSRLYKTGDLCRYMPDGNIEFLGRIDHQIKIRGFRIEPGEIETVLNAHKLVKEAVVIAREDQTGNRYLAAYLICEQEDKALQIGDLREFLKTKLPDYMIPTFFVFMEALPLTPNGKLDRKALPSPDVSVMLKEYVPPRTETEKQIAIVWKSVLKLEKVGVFDNFFELGGHSLLATVVISHLREIFGIEIPIKSLFEFSVISEFGDYIEKSLITEGVRKYKSIKPISRTEPLLLSFAQQRLWFLDRLEEGESATYNIPMYIRVKGSLDISALKKTINEIVRRHEVLRTVIKEPVGNKGASDEPVQVILPELTIEIPVIDISDFNENDRVIKAAEIASKEALKPFDLSKGPLLRAGVIKIDHADNILSVNVHHIAFDGWSAGVFFEEFKTLYKAFSTGESYSLPDIEIQYADFAKWQRELLSGEVYENQLSYWKENLNAAPALLELPFDRFRPKTQTFNGDFIHFEIEKELAGSLNDLSKKSGCTLFMTLYAAFAVLLSKYSGMEDILIGSPIASRNHKQIEPLIGFFVNTLVLRADLTGNPKFTDILSRIKNTTLNAYEHQDIPYEKLVDELDIERNLSHSPLFQVMFILQNVPMGSFVIKGLKFSFFEIEHTIAKFDLSLYMHETGNKINGMFEYNTDLFDRTTIERMKGHFKTLLTDIVVNSDKKVSGLSIMTEAEQRQLLVVFNDTRTDYPKDKCIHQLFEEQAKKTPEAIAVVFEDKQLTYRELDEAAKNLAHRLRPSGIGPGVFVGICLERSLDMLVGLLGILKAGGAYVPMDPSFPAERIGYMIEDTEAPVILAHAQTLPLLSGVQTKIVNIDSADENFAAISNNLISKASPEDIAYVMFTSGSTGRPKGVQVTHKNVVNFLNSMRKEPGFSSKDALLAVTTISFDISVLELFLPVITGGTCVLASKNETLDGQLLINSIERNNITVMQATPATWRILESAGMKKYLYLKALCGGEPLPPDIAAFLTEKCKSLWNMYGPTETTIWSTIEEVKSGADITIGWPIDNTTIYILDKNLNHVPEGVPGAFYIGGDGVTRGYLKRPELTEKKFIQNPFSNDPSDIIYNTGDLARYLPDLKIECLGRVDTQIKLRGFRIELGEIEAVLSEYPDAQNSAVTVKESSTGEKHLAAYLTPKEKDKTPEPGDLRKFLQAKLPDYMIPAFFVFLDTLPLTPNGKIDRKALPALDASAMQKEYVAPRTETEKQVATVWKSILKLEKVGVFDNFFELGGHSLLATVVISHLQEIFEIDIPIKSLFEFPVISEFGDYIEKRLITEGVRKYKSIKPISRTEPLLLSFAQQRLWFLNKFEKGESAAYNIPIFIRVKGRLDLPSLKKAINEIAKRHEILRTVIKEPESREEASNEPVQVILPELTIEMPVIDISDFNENDRVIKAAEIASKEALKPFDLSKGPLLRAGVIKLDHADNILSVNVHHIAFDGWSAGVFFEEFKTLYKAFSTGESYSLPDIEIQYADFAKWQRELLSGEVYENQLSYWKDNLNASPALFELPFDRPRPKTQTFKGDFIHFEIEKELAGSLNDLTEQSGGTLFMTLYAAFAVLLAKYSGMEDIVIGSPIANRNHKQIELLIGFFVNTLVLRADLTGNPKFTDILSRIKDTTLDAYENQDIPFEKLVDELDIERSLSHSPLFQVMFVLQNAPMDSFELPDLESSRFEFEHNISKFDLTLSMGENNDRIEGAFEYNTDLFNRITIERMIGHFVTLLKGISDSPEQKISDIPMLTDEERHKILMEWNDTKADYPKDKCIHQLFEEQAEKTPDAVAVVFEDEQLTYEELNERANQLGHYLQKLGVAPEVLVGICMERSIEMIVGLLGILKAGGAYVPLDPEHPEDRIAYMLEDTKAPVLLTQKRLKDTLPEHNVAVVNLDTDWDEIANESGKNAKSNVRPDNLSYVIYTSGSTGLPKGTLIEHKNIVNLTVAQNKFFKIDETEKILQFSSICFDASAEQIWLALTSGSLLVLVAEEILIDNNKFECFLIRHKITHLDAVPSFLNNIRIRKSDSIKRIIASAEACPVELAKRLSGDYDFYNVYGSTEATVTSIEYGVFQKTLLLNHVPIGRPIVNTQIYILDKYMNPVPIGVSGELHIGGAGLARGYLNRPDLTKEKFISNPFSDEPGSRLYKTGDLCRYLPDGNIEFLGRIDHQVKIRGFRIESGEIEAVLIKHQQVKEAVVIAREDQPDNKRLVAYFTPEEENQPDINELREFLKAKLPDYMIPAFFVFMDALPLTPNGKTDRKALPSPDPDLMREHEFIAPRIKTEERIAEIWTKVLNLEKVSINDNFFEVGGNSLLTVRLVSLIEQSFGKTVTVAGIFEYPTIKQLSQIMDKKAGAIPFTPIVKFKTMGKKRPLFLIHYGNGDVFHFADLVQEFKNTEQPIYGLRAYGLEPGTTPLSNIELIAEKYLDAIRSIQHKGPFKIAGHCLGGVIAYEMAQQLKQDDEQTDFLAVINSPAPPIAISEEEKGDVHSFIRLFWAIGGVYQKDILSFYCKRQGISPDDGFSCLLENVHSSSEKERLEIFLQSAQDAGIPFKDEDVEFLYRSQKTLNSHVLAESVYTPLPYNDRLVIFSAIQNNAPIEKRDDQPTWMKMMKSTILDGETKEISKKNPDSLGWEQYCDNLEIHKVPGSHFSMVRPPHVGVLAEKFRRHLK